MNTIFAKYIFRLMTFSHGHYLNFMSTVSRTEAKRKLKSCGDGFRLFYPSTIYSMECMDVGDNVHINRGAFIAAKGGLRIGDNVHIARNLTIYTINHNYKGTCLPYDHTLIEKPVLIEKNVWIGINVTIIPGVTIHEGAIIGAGTVVAKDIPPLAIVGSGPQHIYKYRDEVHYKNLDSHQMYGGPSGYLYQSNNNVQPHDIK
ncbi:acyltransferase [Anaerolineales bacterium HSG24]|nr:acyltransferase [Anaerolineales bacterium HSG24]